MDDKLKKILDALPDKPPRSRLEPYRAFIEELRRRDRTFREIAGILAEKCHVQVTASGIHDFLRARSRRARSQTSNTPRSTRLDTVRPPASVPTETSSGGEVQRRIAELKARNLTAKQSANAFEYDPDEPLRLKRSINK
jgi:hypothetical protein